jgi:hypothetical protein
MRAIVVSIGIMILSCACPSAFAEPAQPAKVQGCNCTFGGIDVCMTPSDCRSKRGQCTKPWGLPRDGGYTKSCKNCVYDCNVLTCDCDTGGGKYVSTNGLFPSQGGNCAVVYKYNKQYGGVLDCGP